jgi:UDP-N-acetylglucosamine 2-epimerase
MKIFLASFSRASNGAISLLKEKLEKEEMLTYDLESANYVMAVGDRWETYKFVFDCWQSGKKIIHLWAGECTPGCDDEIHRHAMTLMSDMQLCTNEHAQKRVEALCKVGGKEPNVYVVGNIMMENIELNDSVLAENGLVPGEYDIILYNPFRGHIIEDLAQIQEVLFEKEVIHLKKGENKESGFKTPFLWLRPNTDRGSEFILHYIGTRYALSPAQPRPKFLSLIKNCRYFITNSSCAHYEAPFLIKKKQIIQIGLRNAERESKYAKMDIPNASENVIKALKDLETTQNQRRETF